MRIDFYQIGDAELFASRKWDAVPRCGDDVTLRNNGKKLKFQVVRVEWMDTTVKVGGTIEAIPGNPLVVVYILRIK